MFYWGTYWPEWSTTENGQFTPINIDHLARLLNGEITTSQHWPEYEGMVHDGISGDEGGKGIGILHINSHEDTKQSTLSLTGIGYIFFITPNNVQEIMIAGFPSMSAFVKEIVVIEGNSYFIYYMSTANNDQAGFDLNLIYE
ncbi:MAG: hypothetical protein FWD36_04130 [Treponema sp.]|nr:hypothetical protein [Treponema sp.]